MRNPIVDEAILIEAPASTKMGTKVLASCTELLHRTVQSEGAYLMKPRRRCWGVGCFSQQVSGCHHLKWSFDGLGDMGRGQTNLLGPAYLFQLSFHAAYPDGAQLKAGDEARGGSIQSQKDMVGRRASMVRDGGRSTEVACKCGHRHPLLFMQEVVGQHI